jgi:glycosyltransferase involved in cell wall biosynthesis
MHILLIHQAFASIDEPGGTRHHELSRHLAGCGHSVTVITSPISYLTGRTRTQAVRWVEKEERDPGVTILYAYTYPEFHRSFFHRMVAFLSFMISSFFIGLGVNRVDLVWGTSPPIFQAGTAWALARLKRIPFLFEIRDLWPAFAIQVGVLRQPMLIRAAEWFERFLYRHADQILINSPGFADHVMERGARHVEILPNGADVAMFDLIADGVEFRTAHNLVGKFIALYAGAHGLSNDLGILLEAANLLKDRPEIVIVLLGDGKEKPTLQARASELGLTNVLFVPPVPKLQMPDVLAASNACIAILKPIPLYATVYPNKVFDYMAAAKPVILAINGVIQQVIESARAGLSIPPGDPASMAQAIRFLADHPEESRAMGSKGRRCVEESFDRSLLAEKLLVILEQLVKEYNPPRAEQKVT